MFRFAALPMKVSRKDETGDAFHPTLLAAFANAPSYGGGMKIAPWARLDDGKLDICLVREVNKFKAFCLFPTIYFGRHVKVAGVDSFQTDWIRLETESPLALYADGEYVCETPVEIGILPRALQVIVPSV